MNGLIEEVDIKSKIYIIRGKQAMLDSEYNNLKVIYNDTFHDKYFIVDNKVYHCRASINGIGYKTFSITLMNDKESYEMLLDKINK